MKFRIARWFDTIVTTCRFRLGAFSQVTTDIARSSTIDKGFAPLRTSPGATDRACFWCLRLSLLVLVNTYTYTPQTDVG